MPSHPTNKIKGHSSYQQGKRNGHPATAVTVKTVGSRASPPTNKVKCPVIPLTSSTNKVFVRGPIIHKKGKKEFSPPTDKVKELVIPPLGLKKQSSHQGNKIGGFSL
jgi:hypothetical protein